MLTLQLLTSKETRNILRKTLSDASCLQCSLYRPAACIGHSFPPVFISASSMDALTSSNAQNNVFYRRISWRLYYFYFSFAFVNALVFLFPRLSSLIPVIKSYSSARPPFSSTCLLSHSNAMLNRLSCLLFCRLEVSRYRLIHTF